VRGPFDFFPLSACGKVVEARGSNPSPFAPLDFFPSLFHVLATEKWMSPCILTILSLPFFPFPSPPPPLPFRYLSGRAPAEETRAGPCGVPLFFFSFPPPPLFPAHVATGRRLKRGGLPLSPTPLQAPKLPALAPSRSAPSFFFFSPPLPLLFYR